LPVFNPTLEKTYKFLDRFLKEMTALFPDPYFHLGGDEVDPKHWKENPEIQKFMKKTIFQMSLLYRPILTAACSKYWVNIKRKWSAGMKFISPACPRMLSFNPGAGNRRWWTQSERVIDASYRMAII